MNKYGRLAIRHWETTDPDRYAAIPNPEAFFSEMGERAEIEIQQIQDALAGTDPAEETYVEKVGRLNMARLQAEEQELGRADPDPGAVVEPGRGLGGERAGALAPGDERARLRQAEE